MVIDRATGIITSGGEYSIRLSGNAIIYGGREVGRIDNGLVYGINGLAPIGRLKAFVPARAATITQDASSAAVVDVLSVGTRTLVIKKAADQFLLSDEFVLLYFASYVPERRCLSYQNGVAVGTDGHFYLVRSCLDQGDYYWFNADTDRPFKKAKSESLTSGTMILADDYSTTLQRFLTTQR